MLKATIIVGAAICNCAYSTPPEYLSFHREQSKNPTIDKDTLIRIWMMYVGQGDAILIQIPGTLVGQDEPLDVLVDAGSFKKSDAHLANDFLSELYEGTNTLENIVISHHDSDHVSGLDDILRNENFNIDNVWHNGLASYNPLTSGLSEVQLKNTVSSQNRIMGELEADQLTLKSSYVIKNLTDLRTKKNASKFQGVYENLANLLLQKKPQIQGFNYAHNGSEFIRVNNNDITFEPIWPLKARIKFGDWGKTINGNSLTFKFSYKDFQMLFTGDLNEQSEPALLDHLRRENKLSLLECDVLKVPHHGSDHSIKEFFQDEHMNAILGIASMGATGFETNWEHPSTNIIGYLGGAHRFYSTYIHERKFDYADLLQASDKKNMVEKTHILIETDGNWFRVVEIPIDQPVSESNIPKLQYVKRGDGTLWIKTSL